MVSTMALRGTGGRGGLQVAAALRLAPATPRRAEATRRYAAVRVVVSSTNVVDVSIM